MELILVLYEDQIVAIEDIDIDIDKNMNMNKNKNSTIKGQPSIVWKMSYDYQVEFQVGRELPLVSFLSYFLG